MRITKFDFHNDYSPLILWQYLEAEKLKGIVDNQSEFSDKYIRDFWDDYNTNVFNLRTADSFGLSVWGILLNQPRPLYTDLTPFSDDDYRTWLLAQVFNLTFDGTEKSLRHFLNDIFPNIEFSITDNGDMTVNIKVLNEDELTNAEKALIKHPNFLPRPTAVDYTFDGWGVDYSRTFGFEDQTFEGDQLPGFGDPENPDAGGTFYK